MLRLNRRSRIVNAASQPPHAFPRESQRYGACDSPRMDTLRLAALTGLFLSAMLGGLYVMGTEHGAAQPPPSVPAPLSIAPVVVAAPHEETLPEGIDIPLELMAADDAEVFVDAATGVGMGPLTVRIAAAPTAPASPRVAAASHAARPRRATARPLELPRLDANPGRHVLLTARGMIARNETVRGSCYAYLTEVFDRAGHEGWRTRTIVHQAGASGPYADLDRIQPGDWLYIVNNPNSTPMGTHSVLFVRWEDRANGYARTISHAGWAAGASPGREGSHDVSRTYRIIRPRLAE